MFFAGVKKDIFHRRGAEAPRRNGEEDSIFRQDLQNYAELPSGFGFQAKGQNGRAYRQLFVGDEVTRLKYFFEWGEKLEPPHVISYTHLEHFKNHCSRGRFADGVNERHDRPHPIPLPKERVREAT
jgi:hypothetical protein